MRYLGCIVNSVALGLWLGSSLDRGGWRWSIFAVQLFAVVALYGPWRLAWRSDDE